MTVGSLRPVCSTSLESLSATSMRGLRPSCVSASYSFSSLLYFSTYRRIVAPCDPVPDRRTTKREPSSNVTYRPWFFDTEWSIGSV